jgi:hypothetical protein
MIRRYPAVPELNLAVDRFPEPPPLDAFARLAWAGIRLTDDGLTLIATVPPAVAASQAWPWLDRLCARHAPWLADLAVVVAEARRRFPPAAVEARLRAVVPPLADAAYELAGGKRRFRALLRRPLAGPRLDLADAIFAQLVQIEGVVSGAITVGDRAAPIGGEPPARLLRFPAGEKEACGTC